MNKEKLNLLLQYTGICCFVFNKKIKDRRQKNNNVFFNKVKKFLKDNE
jgi:glycine betaine/choline ABC-type transport system substrate-binding protein